MTALHLSVIQNQKETSGALNLLWVGLLSFLGVASQDERGSDSKVADF